jgi:hypothetical protein
MPRRPKIETAQAIYAEGTNQIVGTKAITRPEEDAEVVYVAQPQERDIGVVEEELTFVLRPTNRLMPELLRGYRQALMRDGLIDVGLEIERIEREVLAFQGALETSGKTRGLVDYPTTLHPFGEPPL